MPRINGSGFKMKRTPVKGKLGDFFSSLGKQLRRNRKDIGGEFKGVRQKDKPRRSAAELNKSTDKEININTKTSVDPAASTKNSKITVPELVKKNNNTTKVTGALGSKTRKEQYDALGYKYDDTIKGYNRDGTKKKKKGNFRVQVMVGKRNVSTDNLKKMSKLRGINKTKQGTEMYTYHSPNFETKEEANTYMEEARLAGFENAFIPSPIDKKSPTKKKGYKMPGYGKRK